MTDIDTLIDAQHAQAERAEQDARRIEQRLAAISGCESFARGKRSYGNPPNPWAGNGNMTVQGLVMRADPALGRYLATAAGKSTPKPDYAAEAEAERWAASARRLEADTERLRQARQQRQASTRRWSNTELREKGWGMFR